ncbi:MAG: ATP-binding protein [Roseiflexaceae bacterium]
MKSAPGQGTSSAAEEVFAGGGEMGALMRGLNWSRTPLGPVEDWPQSLRTTVSILLNSRHPMFIFWGPRLAKLYNDGYRPILGAKHPGALGQPGPEVWPEIWDTIGPMVEHVLSQGEATWSDDLMLFMHRNGYLEEVYFTFSYSPVRDETGGVGGMFCACIETTERVLGERRLRTLRDLAARAGEAKTAADACRMAADTLANNTADIPFALLYLIDTGGKIARLVGAVGLAPNTPASPELVDLAAGGSHDCWPMAAVADTGRAQLVDDLLARFGALSVGPWPAPHSALVLPIAQPGQDWPGGLLVAGISPRRALDDDYRGFFDLVAGQVATAVAIQRNAERIAHLQTVTTMLAEALTPTEVAEVMVAQGLAALSARAGSVALLVDGATALEIVSEFGYREELISPWRHFSIDDSTPMSDAVRAASPVWLESLAERNARYPNLPPSASDDGAWVALPLLAKGRPIGAIGLSFAQPRIFDADDQAFMLTLAQQCAQALDRARLYVEAEAAVAARDELLSVVSHDLKNPLATVKGFAQLLRRRIVRLDSPEIVRLLDGLDKIDLAATRMGKQIAELLDATRLHAGQPLDLDRQPTNLVVLVRQVLAEAQQTTQSHTIRLIAPDEELVGNYDSARLDRVFANLLQNAIKYSPQGGAIAVELAREERDGASWAIVAVSDQGIGIPADDLPQIFERFHRAGNVAGQIQGTGIGLSSASQIVKQHGGTIDVVSQEGVGSTFTVRLPLGPASSEL